MRNALRQLVLAERELRSRSGLRTGPDVRPEDIADVMPGAGSDGLQSGA